MKKILITVLAVTSLLFAESYQVNTLSAKQMGMAHVGAGMKLGSESMHFNPGGLGFLNKTLDVSAGATFIMPKVEFKDTLGNKTVNDELGTPLYVYAAYKIADMVSAGISFTTPYGNTVDYGKEWAGADLVQSISLAVYTLQPTVAVKPIEQLSIGAGPTINFGSFSLSKRLMTAGTLNGLRAVAPFAQDPNLGPFANGIISTVDKYADQPVSAEFSGDADVGIGFHVGALYDIIQDKLAFGVSYRSKVDMKLAKGEVEGTEDITALNANISKLKEYTKGTPYEQATDALPILPVPSLENGTFKAQLPLPANLNVGVSFRPIDALLLDFDWQMVFWGTYDELAIDFPNEVTVAVPGVGTIPFNKTPNAAPSIKKYHNTNAFRLGAQYTVMEALDARLGAYYDQTPVDDDYLTPESPSTNKLGLTAGVSVRPLSGLSIDASFLYATSLGDREAEVRTDKLDGLKGKYNVTALVPSIGLNYSF